jgi:hypothetical protein
VVGMLAHTMKHLKSTAKENEYESWNGFRVLAKCSCKGPQACARTSGAHRPHQVVHACMTLCAAVLVAKALTLKLQLWRHGKAEATLQG